MRQAQYYATKAQNSNIQITKTYADITASNPLDLSSVGHIRNVSTHAWICDGKGE